MSSPINTDIFSETGCVRRDLLLRYRDVKLTAGEKHEVEKHLVDCPLCDEALEGLMMVTGTAVLDDINAAVREQSAAPAGWKPTHYFAVAASFSALILLSWFAFRQLKDVPEQKMAANEVAVPETAAQPPAAATIQKAEELHEPSDQEEMNQAAVSDVKKNISKISVGAEVAEPLPVNKDEASLLSDDVSDAPDAVAEPVAVTEKEESLYSITGKSYDIDKTVTNSGTYTAHASPLITYIDNLKVIDYNLNIPDESVREKSEPASTESKFENKDKKEQEKRSAKSSGMVMYRKTNYINLLTDPVVLFNKKRYQSAIDRFNEILALHPGDENAIFYKGLSFYHLGEYSNAVKLLKVPSSNPLSAFYEEANFYLGKAYIDSGDSDKGVAILKEVVSRKGFYASKAAEELTKMDR